MRQQELNDHLGVDETRFQKVVVSGNLLPGACSVSSTMSLRNVIERVGIEESCRAICARQHPTYLDLCLGNLDVGSDSAAYEINLPVETEIVVAAIRGNSDNVDMMICPPAGSRSTMETGTVSLPLFEIEYVIEDVPAHHDFEVVCDAMDLLRLQYETELLFDLLLKSLRSQRNKVEAPFSTNAVTEAFELIERESRAVKNCLLNTKAYASWRDRIDLNDGLLFGAKAYCCSPHRRGNLKRNYFLGAAHMLGVCARSQPWLSLEDENGAYRMSYLIRTGAVVVDRSLISSVEGP